MSIRTRLAIGVILAVAVLAEIFFILQKENNQKLSKGEKTSIGEDLQVSTRVSVGIAPGMTYPPTVRLNGDRDFLDRAERCVYSHHSWLGTGGNGLSVDWGDGTQSPDPQKSKAMDGQSCEKEMLQHTYAASGTYTITVYASHPGPTDAPVTDWSDQVTVTVP